MGAKILAEIEKQKPILLQTTKTAISGNVPAIQRNFELITNVHRSEKFFYRQTKDFDDYPRKALMQRFLEFYHAIAGATREGGFLIEEAFNDAVALHDELASAFAPSADIWNLFERIEETLIKLRRAYVMGDRIQMRQMIFNMTKQLTAMQYAVRRQGIN